MPWCCLFSFFPAPIDAGASAHIFCLHFRCHRSWSKVPPSWTWTLQAWGSLQSGWNIGSPCLVSYCSHYPPGLLITSLTAVISFSDRLARVHRGFFSSSSTSFMATVWLKPSLRIISSISVMMISGGLSAAGACLPSITVTTLSSYFLSKSPPSLLLMMTRVFGSDKLEKSRIICNIQWIMALAWWLTLLECHHIQLNINKN